MPARGTIYLLNWWVYWEKQVRFESCFNIIEIHEYVQCDEIVDHIGILLNVSLSFKSFFDFVLYSVSIVIFFIKMDRNLSLYFLNYTLHLVSFFFFLSLINSAPPNMFIEISSTFQYVVLNVMTTIFFNSHLILIWFLEFSNSEWGFFLSSLFNLYFVWNFIYFIVYQNTQVFHRHSIFFCYFQISGNSNEEQLIISAITFFDRPEMLQKVLRDIVPLFDESKCEYIGQFLNIVLEAMDRHVSDSDIQYVGRWGKHLN